MEPTTDDSARGRWSKLHLNSVMAEYGEHNQRSKLFDCLICIAKLLQIVEVGRSSCLLGAHSFVFIRIPTFDVNIHNVKDGRLRLNIPDKKPRFLCPTVDVSEIGNKHRVCSAVEIHTYVYCIKLNK